MIEITDGNYKQRSGSGSTFRIDVDLSCNDFLSYYEESRVAAEKIWSNKQGEVYVMYSGGVDSEYVINVFLSCGMKVTPVIVTLSPGYNNHDTKYAFAFCESKNIKPVVVDIDFMAFIESGTLNDIVEQIRAPVYHTAATCYAIGKLSGTVLLGFGEPDLSFVAPKRWNIKFFEYDYTLQTFFEQQRICGTPFFNCYTKEMMCAFLANDNVTSQIVLNNPNARHSNQGIKQRVYGEQRAFVMQPRPKFNGYEHVPKHEELERIVAKNAKRMGVYTVDYMDFVHKHGVFGGVDI